MNIYVEEIGGWQAVRLTPWIPSSPTIAMVVLHRHHCWSFVVIVQNLQYLSLFDLFHSIIPRYGF